jgi:hypothetical protein
MNALVIKKISRIVRALVIRGLWPGTKVPVILRAEWATLYKEAIWRKYQPRSYDGDVLMFGTDYNYEVMKAARSKIVVGNLDCSVSPVTDHGGVLSDPDALKLVASMRC